MKRLLLAVLLICGGIAAEAQAGTPTGSTPALEYTVGDVKYGRVISSATIVVMQSELLPANGDKKAYVPKEITGMEVYPSPVENTIYFQPNSNKRSRLEFAMYDGDGNEVLRRSVVLETGHERQEANINKLAVGQYTMLVKWMEGSNIQVNAYRVQKL